MKIIRKILLTLKNITDTSWYAEQLGERSGLFDKARNSKFRKWQEGLTGWKFWVWQIVGGISFVIIMEFVLNKIGLTMLPWR